MSRLYMLIGIPGSGKSTWAKKISEQNGACWISRDAIRFSMLKEDDDYFAYEDTVIDTFIADIQNAIEDNTPVIIADATHLTQKSRNQVLERLSLKGTPVVYVYFDVPLTVALERNEKREGRAKVPRSVIRRMYYSIQKPEQDCVIVNEEGECII